MEETTWLWFALGPVLLLCRNCSRVPRSLGGLGPLALLPLLLDHILDPGDRLIVPLPARLSMLEDSFELRVGRSELELALLGNELSEKARVRGSVELRQLNRQLGRIGGMLFTGHHWINMQVLILKMLGINFESKL